MYEKVCTGGRWEQEGDKGLAAFLFVLCAVYVTVRRTVCVCSCVYSCVGGFACVCVGSFRGILLEYLHIIDFRGKSFDMRIK